MSQVIIIRNALDMTEQDIVETDCVLRKFLEIKKVHPQAKIYKGNPCGETDVTPSLDNSSSIEYLHDSKEDFTIVCYPGEMISAVNYVSAKLFGAAVSAFVKIPKLNNSSSTGSSNNNLGDKQNRERLKQRVPYIIGRVKSIPDLFTPVYRCFKGGIETEISLLSVSENPVAVSDFKEGDTFVKEIPGTSLTAYAPGQNITGTENIFKVGSTFDTVPLVTKQNKSINGQTLLPPNSTRIEANDVYFEYPNIVKTLNQSSSDQFDKFVVNETVMLEGANYGIADFTVTGSTTILFAEHSIQLTSTQTSAGYDSYRKINITAMLVADPSGAQLDLAGLYDIETIIYANNIYTIKLKDPAETNANFANLTANATVNISANLTANTANIFLDGTYVITGIDLQNQQLTLASPSTVNSDWEKLYDLTGKQTPNARVKFRGSQSNNIGWFTINSKLSTGLLLNFKAANGIYKGSKAKQVDIIVEYQKVIDEIPTGIVYSKTLSIFGKANNRDSVGGSLYIDLPFTGAVRFRARRTNDNGDDAELMDETKFYSAYAYHKLERLVEDLTLVRQETQATASATSADSRELNCIAESLVYSYRDGVRSAERIKSRNFADLVIDLALNDMIGRCSLSEINIDRLYQVADEIEEYFGSERMTEFNYTLDDAKQSFEEILRMIAIAICSHDRRSSTVLYFDFERSDSMPIILFNHRNKLPESESRKFSTKIENNYDGIELTYVDSDLGWIEQTIKLPDEQIKNAKKIDALGVVYKEQAHIIACREWNKLRYKYIDCKFTGYAESELVFKGDLIAVVDDTRLTPVYFGDPQLMITSGEIVKWSGLSVEVSQPCLLDFTKSYVIHLQLKNATMEAIPITQGVDKYHFNLARQPQLALVTEGDIKTTYSITTDDRQNDQVFLLLDKKSNHFFENELTAINLDERYYQNDNDIKLNLI